MRGHACACIHTHAHNNSVVVVVIEVLITALALAVMQFLQKDSCLSENKFLLGNSIRGISRFLYFVFSVQTLEQERVMYKEKNENLEHEFKVMHEQLTSEIKLLSE